MAAQSTGQTTTTHAADRLLDAIAAVGAPVCVGLDPVVERLPDVLRPRGGEATAAVAALAGYCRGVMDAVAPHVPCIKLQSACFERYRAPGVEALWALIAEARQRGLQVILDAKRGDIGISAEHYAEGFFGAGWAAAARPDWITLSGYLGADALGGFARAGHGAFVLVRTSNPGGDDLQGQVLADGTTVAQRVAALVAEAGAASVGPQGFSALGAVVGATRPGDMRRLREIMPRQIFLVPGYGSQGGTAADVAACFGADGTGAVVTASRSVIYAFEGTAGPWQAPVADAARRMAEEIAHAAGR